MTSFLRFMSSSGVANARPWTNSCTLPLSGIIGAVVGIGIGLVDFGLVASFVRRLLTGRMARLSPWATEGLMRVLFLVNALVFGALGWWFGVSMAGTGLAPTGG